MLLEPRDRVVDGDLEGAVLAEGLRELGMRLVRSLMDGPPGPTWTNGSTWSLCRSSS
jgi:hypothetical protein